MPPTAQETIILDGALGLETNVSQHSGDPKSFRIFRDLVTDRTGRIIKRDGRGPTLGSVAGTEIQALHEYVYVDPTTGAESYHTLGAIDGGSFIYRWNGVATWTGQTLPIAPSAGGRWGFCNADNRVFAFNGKDALLVGIQTAPSTITWKTAGVDAPTFAPTYSLTAVDPPVTDATTGKTVTCVQGSKTVTASAAGAFTTGASWNGIPFRINGNWYTVSTVTDSSHLELTEGFKEVGASGLGWAAYIGIGTWDDIAPQYRFSYYNPTTGHASNPSPILQVTETFQKGRTLQITIPGSAENTTAYTNGYTQIQLFRTPKSAGIPVALNEKLANVNTGAAIVYVETSTKFKDTYLTDFQAPLLNFKPPSGICSMVEHGQRQFYVHKPSGRVGFTPIQDLELDFGVASESFPPLFKLRIQAPRAVLNVGGQSSADSLIVQTSRGDYSVDGFNSVTFSPYRTRTRRSGSYLGAATDVDGDLVEFYADNRVMVMRQDIAQKIQDKLNSVKPLLIDHVRLHWFAANSRNYLLLSIPKSNASTANDYTYVFDLDLGGGPIYEWNFGMSAFATVHDSTTLALQLFGGDPTGAVYRLFTGNNQDAGANFQSTLRTALFRGDEQRSAIKYIKIFVNDAQLNGGGPATFWTGVLYINEQTNAGAANGEAIALVFRQVDYRFQSAQGLELEATFTTSKRVKSKVFQIDITFPSANAALWIDQIIIGFDRDQTVAAQA